MPDLAVGLQARRDLLKKQCLTVADADACFRLPGGERSAVISTRHPKHPGAVTVQPAISEACGGGDCCADHRGMGEAGTVSNVRQIDIGEGIEENDAVCTHPEGEETAQADGVGRSSSLALPLDPPAGGGSILE